MTTRDLLIDLQAAGFGTKALAHRFGVSRQTIWNVRSGHIENPLKNLDEKVKSFHVALKNAGFFDDLSKDKSGVSLST